MQSLLQRTEPETPWKSPATSFISWSRSRSSLQILRHTVTNVQLYVSVLWNRSHRIRNFMGLLDPGQEYLYGFGYFDQQEEKN